MELSFMTFEIEEVSVKSLKVKHEYSKSKRKEWKKDFKGLKSVEDFKDYEDLND